MNKSVCENCMPKSITVSLEKNPQQVDFYQITTVSLLTLTKSLYPHIYTAKSL